MSEPERKTYRIWFKPGARKKIDFNHKLETYSFASQKREYIIGSSREQSFDCTNICLSGGMYSFADESLPNEIELDLEKNEDGSIIVFFNKVPKMLISDVGIPSECPSQEIRALFSFKERSPDNIFRISKFKRIHCLYIEASPIIELAQLGLAESTYKIDWINANGLTGLKNLKSLYLKQFTLTNLNALSGLKNLRSLNLEGCDDLANLNALSGLTNLTYLNLGYSSDLTNLDALSGLTSLRSLHLENCNKLTNLNGVSGLTNLKSLNLGYSSDLTNLDALSGLTSLRSLHLENCNKLTNLNGVSGLTNLKSLNLGYCSDLTNLNALSGLKNLRSLNLERCDLANLNALSGLTNLRSLNLEHCSDFTNLNALSGLTNLTYLNLGYSSDLTNLDALSGLTNLTYLRLGYCFKLSNVDFLSELKNLKHLNLDSCYSLWVRNLDFFSGFTKLEYLNLSRCETLINVDGLSGLKNLMSLDLTGCPYLKKINKLKSCSSLRQLYFNDPVERVRVLSQTGQDDEGFAEDMAHDWLKVARKAPEPEELVCDLSDTFGLYAKESWASDALSQLVDLMLACEECKENTWASLLDAVAKCPNQQAQEILGRVFRGMNQERASSVLRPLLKTLAGLPESLNEWANERADELLDSLDIDFLRDYGPSVCLFYARMGREDRLRSWLEKLTDPETPRWRDRIHLALGQWEIARGDLNSPRARLKEMSQGSFKDELLETLARALAKEKPLEAGELLDQISEEWRQATLSAELAEEAAFTEPAENAYRLLLHMERDPDKLADWVATLTRNHPDSELVKEVARTFGAHETVNALPQILSDLLEEEVIVKATKENQLKSFKEELMAEGEPQSFLLETLVGRMCKRGLVNEEEAKQLLENLKGKQL